jgi:hypothetical protein
MRISETRLRNLVAKILLEASAPGVVDQLVPFTQDMINRLLVFAKQKVTEKITSAPRDLAVGQTAGATLGASGVESQGAIAAGRAALATGSAAGGVSTGAGAGAAAAATAMAPAVLIAIATATLAKTFEAGYEAIKAKMQAVDAQTSTAFKTAVGEIFVSGVQAGKLSKLWDDQTSKVAWNAYKKFINLQPLNNQEIAAIALVDSCANDQVASAAFNKARNSQYVDKTNLEVLIAQYRSIVRQNQINVMNTLSSSGKKQT